MFRLSTSEVFEGDVFCALRASGCGCGIVCSCQSSWLLADTSHAQYAGHFVLWVVAEGEVLAAPFAFTEVVEGDGNSSEGAEHEEYGSWWRSISTSQWSAAWA